MRIGASETRGVSWPDPDRPGVRHWQVRRTWVSGHPHGLLWWLAWACLIGPYWAGINILLLELTIIACCVSILAGDGGQVVLRRSRWFWWFGLDLPSGEGR